MQLEEDQPILFYQIFYSTQDNMINDVFSVLFSILFYQVLYTDPEYPEQWFLLSSQLSLSVFLSVYKVIFS